MKHDYKYSLKKWLVVVWAVLGITVLLPAQNLPRFHETFNGPGFPAGWRQVDHTYGSSNAWVITSGSPTGFPLPLYNGSKNITLKATNANYGAQVHLISPKINLSGLNNPKISFWAYISMDTSMMNHLGVYYNVLGDTANGYPLMAFNLFDTAHSGWTYFETQLNESASNNSHVYFSFNGTVVSNGIILLDEFKVEEGEPMCVANFTYTNPNGNMVIFNNTSTSIAQTPDYHFTWDFGDGQWLWDTGLVSVSHNYEFGGFYTVTLTMTENSTGCWKQISQNIQVGDPGSSCLANFQYTYNLSDSTFTFTNTSLGLINNTYWCFGDGTYSTSTNATHKYAHHGFYNVILNISNDSGCVSSIAKDVLYGNPDCIARFNYFYNPSDDSVYFYDNSMGLIDSWYWNFGDGYTSYNQFPVHKYANNGFYNVKLTVVNNAAGCTDSYQKLIGAGTDLCEADFTYIVDPATRNVIFTANTAPTITNYFWDFGDGTYSDLPNPTHQYAEDGLYNVLLAVNDGFNGQCMNWVNKEVQVGIVNCNAAFSYINLQGTNTVVFNNETYGNPTHIYWDFGDGTSSSEFSPVHTYPAGGFYYVSLAIWNDNNQCFDYAWDYITVGDPGINCVAKFNYYNNVATKTVTFTNTSIGNIGNVWWDFGDGTSSNAFDTVHTYQENGYYNVSLFISTASGLCYDFVWKRVPAGDVSNIPLADFNYTVDTATNTVVFYNTSYKDNQYRHWDFGDGNFSDEKHPVHTYAQQDLYLVYLGIWDSIGNYSDKWDLVNVSSNTGLQGNFAYIPDTTGTKAAGSVEFKGAAFGDPSRCFWYFGDGATDSLRMNTVHVYQNPGWYNVCFTVSNSNTGQSNTICKGIYVGIAERQKQDFILRIAPNPVRNSASIAYVLPQAMDVKIVISDILGNIKAQPVNEKQQAGLHSFNWNTNDLASGTYILQLITNRGVQYKKFIINR